MPVKITTQLLGRLYRFRRVSDRILRNTGKLFTQPVRMWWYIHKAMRHKSVHISCGVLHAMSSFNGLQWTLGTYIQKPYRKLKPIKWRSHLLRICLTSLSKYICGIMCTLSSDVTINCVRKCKCHIQHYLSDDMLFVMRVHNTGGNRTMVAAATIVSMAAADGERISIFPLVCPNKARCVSFSASDI